MKRVEILEEIKEGVLVRHEGDVVSIDEDLANAYINVGLAKCAETGETGTRKGGAVKLTVNPLIIKTSV
tara:strand:- start:1630 stop:1836 length:207 start_codon:yes stop_codon:yes gene_type:complete